MYILANRRSFLIIAGGIGNWRLESGKVGITLVMGPRVSAKLIHDYGGWRARWGGYKKIIFQIETSK